MICLVRLATILADIRFSFTKALIDVLSKTVVESGVQLSYLSEFAPLLGVLRVRDGGVVGRRRVVERRRGRAATSLPWSCRKAASLPPPPSV